MNSDELDDIEALAGEYVLGTLPLAERQVVARRLEYDVPLREAVDAWERRLQSMQALAPAQTPSDYLWQRVERSIDALPVAPVRAPRERWWQRPAPWRWTSAMGLAASVLFAVLWANQPPPAPATWIVVLVAPQDKAPGWVVQARDARHVQLIPLGMTSVPADKALEFWTKADGWSGPVSLGLVKPGRSVDVPLEALPPLEENQLFELTLESPTGSATGKPTGPVQFIGRAVKVL
ncbi:anti-sigma factor [Pseudomonas sp. 148P]|uniref:Regulator of SigK n=1 Tax=Pseudomonas ulcerans TaxID=3115852 RepID=A0ABU7HSZ1_9PSED|nr:MULTISPECIES: anti-sigma factor [unclassified Pseudomonas]MEE1926206.1 anti-sigma factor [Pseudomonas sp. 147P]MEE1934662.1 anti-sigma factor [Pseudomonas sp. 148P]